MCLIGIIILQNCSELFYDIHVVSTLSVDQPCYNVCLQLVWCTVESLYNGHHWDQQTCPFNRGVLC